MFGDAKAVIDRSVAAGSEQARGLADFLRRSADGLRHRLRAIAVFRDEGGPAGEFLRIAALAHKGLVKQPFGDDDMGQRVHHRDIGARPKLDMVRRLDVRGLHEIDPARIEHDDLRALAQPFLHPAAEHRMRVRRVGADQQNDVGLLHRLEVLRARRGAEGGLQSVAGRRMADPGAGIDIVGAEGRPDHLLDDIDFLVGAARGGNAADGALAVFCLHILQPAGGEGDRLVPGDLAPGIGDRVADHRLGLPVLMGGIAESEAALHAGMALVRAAILPRHHADDLVALHLGAEGAADTAIGTGGDHTA